MKFASLGSGSAGNATLVSSESTHLLIDCGFSLRETQLRLQKLGLTPDQLSAILVTHEHGDHIRGVPVIARKYNIPVYLTQGTQTKLPKSSSVDARIIKSGECFLINHIQVSPVSVPHDATEPVQFVLRAQGKTLGVLTDLGSFTQPVLEAYQNCDALFVEANHDSNRLLHGPYPYSLKKRVGGPWGHLSNDQTALLLKSLDLNQLQHLVIGHISQKNNCLDLVSAMVKPFTPKTTQVIYAAQNEGFDWLTIH